MVLDKKKLNYNLLTYISRNKNIYCSLKIKKFNLSEKV